MHTPGPWHLIDQTEIRNASGCTVCVTSEYRVPGREQEAIADARLIAAAPDLLDALQAVAGDLLDVLSQRMDPKLAEQLPSLEMARAVIAKATREI
jgi:hypothetical protein